MSKNFEHISLSVLKLNVVTGIHKMRVRKANREDPGQTAQVSALFVKAFAGN